MLLLAHVCASWDGRSPAGCTAASVAQVQRAPRHRADVRWHGAQRARLRAVQERAALLQVTGCSSAAGRRRGRRAAARTQQARVHRAHLAHTPVPVPASNR